MFIVVVCVIAHCCFLAILKAIIGTLSSVFNSNFSSNWKIRVRYFLDKCTKYSFVALFLYLHISVLILHNIYNAIHIQ